MLPLYFVHTLLCVNMNRFFINRTIGVSCQNFRVLHRAYALIQYADNAYCYTSLRIRFIVLCQQYSDYTCILSNAPAIFCRYIIVRKYEPLFINRTVGASCQNVRVLHRAARHALLVQAIKISAFACYRRVNALFVYKKTLL